jgi:drug/metabolite transporter (DMT)-like permease
MPLSLAYPFVALTFPLVGISSALLFNEPIGWRSLVGFALIVAGLALTAQQGS